jgi:hypothetical protein
MSLTVKMAGLPPASKTPVADLLDQGSEMERARVSLAVRAVDQHLRLGQVLLGPVHAQPQRIALKVHLAQALAAELAGIARHRRQCAAATQRT